MIRNGIDLHKAMSIHEIVVYELIQTKTYII